MDSEFGKVVEGVNFNDYIHQFIQQTVMPSGLWQGIHFDQAEFFPNPLLGDTNGIDGIGAPLPPIDLDEDSVAESETELKEA